LIGVELCLFVTEAQRSAPHRSCWTGAVHSEVGCGVYFERSRAVSAWNC
jgi:hypothetical protein